MLVSANSKSSLDICLSLCKAMSSDEGAEKGNNLPHRTNSQHHPEAITLPLARDAYTTPMSAMSSHLCTSEVLQIVAVSFCMNGKYSVSATAKPNTTRHQNSSLSAGVGGWEY
jgi:hypothetical protein